MKLGSETGSLVNHVYSTQQRVEPEIGMGATLLSWTDRSAATVVAIERDKSNNVVRFAVTMDLARVTSGGEHDGSATYDYISQQDGYKYWFRPAKDGRWEHVALNPDSKRWSKSKGNNILLGKRDHYRDPSF
jgi:hypothetical protein